MSLQECGLILLVALLVLKPQQLGSALRYCRKGLKFFRDMSLQTQRLVDTQILHAQLDENEAKAKRAQDNVSPPSE